MARILEITVPADQTDDLVKRLRKNRQIISLKLHRGAAIEPAGDVISLQTTNRNYYLLLKMLSDLGIGADRATGLSSSEPTAIYSRPFRDALAADTSESSFEEIEFALAREGNMTLNGLILMVCGGTLAALGLSGGALELVIAAMIISPGFESITRIGLGIITGRHAVRRGLADSLKGYTALILAAAGTSLLLQSLGKQVIGGKEFYLPGSELIKYWTSLSPAAVLSTGIAALAGVTLVAAHRSVLTAGAMIGMGLVPAAAMVGMGIVTGETSLAVKALERWLTEVLLVSAISTLFFLWKRAGLHNRKMIT